jgi:hypothetical protein
MIYSRSPKSLRYYSPSSDSIFVFTYLHLRGSKGCGLVYAVMRMHGWKRDIEREGSTYFLLKINWGEAAV